MWLPGAEVRSALEARRYLNKLRTYACSLVGIDHGVAPNIKQAFTQGKSGGQGNEAARNVSHNFLERPVYKKKQINGHEMLST